MLAYLDASSGSMIVQAIVAGAAGLAVFIKVYWRRLTGVFRRKGASTAQATREPVDARSGADKR